MTDAAAPTLKKHLFILQFLFIRAMSLQCLQNRTATAELQERKVAFCLMTLISSELA